MSNRLATHFTLTAMIVSLLANGLVAPLALADGGTPQLLPFQGRLTDPSGTPINVASSVKFRIYPPTGGSCYLYEHTQTITPNGYGIFSTVIGTPANSTGPANPFYKVFSNQSTNTLNTSCGTPWTPSGNDWRLMEIVVDGTPLPGFQTIGSAAFAMNSNYLEGLAASDFIQKSTNVTQANLESLVGGGDAGSLHNHDSRYLKSDGSTTVTGNQTYGGSIYATGATSAVGIGTTSPSADLQISRTNPAIRLEAASGGLGTAKVEFTSGSTPRGSIQVSENANGMRFFSGTTQALSIDSGLQASFAGNVNTSGTLGLGTYDAVTEPTLTASLGGADKGKMWVYGPSGTVRYWDGSAAQTVATVANTVTSVTAGTGLVNTGSAAAPILGVVYGTGGGQAIQGNAAFGGDVSGNYGSISVDKIKGKGIDFSTAPTGGQVLLYNGTSWVPSAPPITGLTTLNGLTAATQTFAISTTGATPGPAISSSGSTHTFNIPLAGATGTTGGGLITKSEYDTFNNKQNALGYTPVNKAGDTMGGGLAMGGNVISGLGSPSATGDAANKTYVDGVVATAGANYILRDGSVAFTGNQSMGGFKLTTLASPTATGDATNKKYVDDADALKVTKAGDSMSGNLTFSGAAGLSIGGTGTIAMGGNKITNLADPSATGDAANKSYVDASDALKVTKAGDTMSGNLNFSGAAGLSIGGTGTLAMGGNKITNLAAPSATGDATNKQYVDNSVSAISTAAILKDGSVAFTGNQSMGGFKLTTLAAPTATGDATNKKYVDDALALKLDLAGGTLTGGVTFSGASGLTIGGTGTIAMGGNKITGLADPGATGDAANKNYVDAQLAAAASGASGSYVAKSGSTMSGNLAMGGNLVTGLAAPSATGDATNKQYVDAADALKVTKAGDSMSGNLTFSGAAGLSIGGTGTLAMGGNKITNLAAPSATGDAANKQYVDSSVSGLNAAVILRDGSVAFTGNQSMGGFKLTTLAAPTATGDAANKSYVDAGDALKVTKAGDSMSGNLTFSGAAGLSIGGTGTLAMGGNKITSLADPSATGDAANKKYVDNAIASAGTGYVAKAGDTGVGNIALGAQKTIQFGTYDDTQEGAAGFTTGDYGKIWFNTTSNTLKYFDGAVKTLGSVGGAISSLNGLTVATQTFATTATGTTYGISSAGTVHTLNIPMASTAGATKGLLSNAEYTALIKNDGSVAFTGNQSMGGFKLTTLAAPTATGDAANKKYVDDSIATQTTTDASTYVAKAGSTMSGDLAFTGAAGLSIGGTGTIAMGGNKITGLAAPGATGDATNKQYVDNAISTAGGSYLALGGGTMTGSIAMTGAAGIDMAGNKILNVGTPAATGDAANKKYVDDADALKVTKAGDSMSGNLTFSGTAGLSIGGTGTLAMGGNKITNLADPSATGDAANKKYVDNAISGVNGNVILKDGSIAFTNNQSMGGFKLTTLAAPTATGDAANKKYVDDADALKLDLSGGTLTGNLALGGHAITGLAAPSATGDAANKKYVDDGLALKLDLAGGTLTGGVTLSGAAGLSIAGTGTLAMGGNKITGLASPSATGDATNKQYVDNAISTAGGSFLPLAGGTMSGSIAMTGAAAIAMGGNKITNLADPSATGDAANKNYVDTGNASKVSKAGDSMSGNLSFSGAAGLSIGGTGTLAMGGNKITNLADPGATGDAANKNYVDTQVATAVSGASGSYVAKSGGTMSGNLAMGGNLVTGLAAPSATGDATNKQYVDAADALKLNKTGDTLNGVLTMGASGSIDMAGRSLANVPAPSSTGDAANKKYVDDGLALKLDLAGGTLSGTLNLSGAAGIAIGGTGTLAMGGNKITNLAAPSATGDASNKKYVDDAVTTAGGSFLPLGGGTMTGSIAMTGAAGLSMAGNKITKLGAPAATDDAVNKTYADANVAGKTVSGSISATGSALVFDGTNWAATGVVQGVSAGTGITVGGTASNPTIAVTYGNTSTSAIRGNAAFSGDATGTYDALSVVKIQGAPVGTGVAAAATGQVLTWSGSKWDVTTPGAAITSLNGLTSTSQTFAFTNAAGAAGFTSTGSTHTFNLPTASGSTSGLLSSGDWTTFNNKFSATVSSAATGDVVYYDGAAWKNGSVTTALGYTPANGANYLPLAGGSMTGDIAMGGKKVTGLAAPSATGDAANKQYVDSSLSTANANVILKDGSVAFTGNQSMGGFKLTTLAAPTATGDAANKKYVDDGLALKLDLAGGTLTGGLTLSGAAGLAISGTGTLAMGGNKITNLADPSATGDAANKKYVDNAVSTAGGSFLPLSGGTMTGSIAMTGAATINYGGNVPTNLGAPSVTGDAVNKQYADAKVAGKGLTGAVSATGSALVFDGTNWAPTGVVLGVTASTGITVGGTAAAPTIAVTYGNTSTSAIRGNAAFSGDVTGTYDALSVVKIKGTGLAASVATAATGQVLTFDGTNWASATPTIGITSLNGLTSSSQTFAFTNAAGAAGFTSTGSTHTLNLPTASGSTSGILSSADWTTFNSKFSATIASAATGQVVYYDGSAWKNGTVVTALGYTPANGANYLPLAGGTMSADIAMAGSRVTGLAAPALTGDAANKKYVDDSIATAGGSYLPLGGGTLTGALSGTALNLSGAFTGTTISGTQIAGSGLNLSGAFTGTSAKLSGAFTGTTITGTDFAGANLNLSGSFTGTTITGTQIAGSGLNLSGAFTGTSAKLSGAFTGTTITGTQIAGSGLSLSGGFTGTSILLTGAFTGTTVSATTISATNFSTSALSLSGAFTGTTVSATDITAANLNLSGAFTGTSAKLSGAFTGTTITGTQIAGSGLNLSGAFTGTTITGTQIAGSGLSLSGAFTGTSMNLSGAFTGTTISGTALAGSSLNLSGAFTGTTIAGTTLTAGTGTFSSQVTSAAFFYSSDRRLKHDIQTSPGLDAILKLRGVTFRWNKDDSPEVGLIAQEVEQVFPELVTTSPVTGYKAVKYGNLVGPLIEATKDLYGRCEMTESEYRKMGSDLRAHTRAIAELNDRVKKLESENQELRSAIDEIRSALKRGSSRRPASVK